jgi:hypothetical protein
MALLNEDLLENVYMTQSKGFAVEEKEHMGCHLKKFIYGLKQASSQWYLKFYETIKIFGFKENDEANCIYTKFRTENLFFLSYMWMIFYLLVVMLVYC